MKLVYYFLWAIIIGGTILNIVRLHKEIKRSKIIATPVNY